jgi:F-type H+-transporting ATPase subunit epsilon
MARTLLCEIVTPERITYTHEVEMVVVPALDGEMGVLPLHAPLVAALKAGEVRVRIGDETDWFAISGGYLQVYEDKAIILADDAVPSSQIDIERAKQAQVLVREQLDALKAKDAASEDRDRLQADLAWTETQNRVGAHEK